MASVEWNRDERRQKSRIGEWKERIVIQRSRAGTDKAGNHVLSWEDFYVCWAYVNNLSGKEYWEAAQVNAQKDVFFLIRYCSEVVGMDTEHYRIVYRGQVYNITFLDNVKYQNRIVKVRASLAGR
ncbi:phage head closure protein [Enterocloster bolteae]|uniref:phage head closure protein n=1 Tax=Enterocloster bolteae TaxID=208479 RepID=UPI002108BC46|nr:phage head closure protein [Enterocloster bolteae]MCQ5141461.1 phage head closure protein [Enterocloster bolteae]